MKITKYSLWVGKGQNKHNVVCKTNTYCSNNATCTISFPEGLQVSFTLVNSDPDAVLAEWDIQSAVKSEQKPSINSSFIRESIINFKRAKKEFHTAFGWSGKH